MHDMCSAPLLPLPLLCSLNLTTTYKVYLAQYLLNNFQYFTNTYRIHLLWNFPLLHDWTTYHSFAVERHLFPPFLWQMTTIASLCPCPCLCLYRRFFQTNRSFRNRRLVAASSSGGGKWRWCDVLQLRLSNSTGSSYERVYVQLYTLSLLGSVNLPRR